MVITFLDFEFSTKLATLTIGNGHVIGESEIFTRKESNVVPRYVVSDGHQMWILFVDERTKVYERDTEKALFNAEIKPFQDIGKRSFLNSTGCPKRLVTIFNGTDYVTINAV